MRGHTSNIIKDISFSPNILYMSCMSKNGTLHVFKVNKIADSSSMMKNAISGYIEYFNSELHFASCSTRYKMIEEMNPCSIILF